MMPAEQAFLLFHMIMEIIRTCVTSTHEKQLIAERVDGLALLPKNRAALGAANNTLTSLLPKSPIADGLREDEADLEGDDVDA
jgi:hypothetical protein